MVQKSWREGWIAADGKIDRSAYDRLPEALKPFKDVLSKYETDEQLLSAFVHAQTLNGKKGLMPLPENASDKDKAEFSTRLKTLLGVPEKPDGYGVAKPKDMPDALWNNDYVQGAVGVMHKHNASPALVRELLEYDAKAGGAKFTQMQADQAQTFQKAKAQLEGAFGQNYAQGIESAKRMARALGVDVKDPSVGNNPTFIIALSKAAAMISEDKLVKGNEGGDGGFGTNAREQSLDILRNPANPLYAAYHDRNHPQHKVAVDKKTALDAAFIALKKTA